MVTSLVKKRGKTFLRSIEPTRFYHNNSCLQLTINSGNKIQIKDIERTVEKLKNHKATRCDSIAAELLKQERKDYFRSVEDSNHLPNS